MARHSTTHTRRPRRRNLRRVATTVASHWGLVLLSHVIATTAVLVAAQLLHVPSCGR